MPYTQETQLVNIHVSLALTDNLHVSTDASTNANHNTINCSSIQDNFSHTAVHDNNAPSFIDSITKARTLLRCMIDDYNDNLIQTFHENCIFDIFNLGFLTPNTNSRLNFDGNKMMHALGWSYKLQLIQLAEYIQSFIKLGKLINDVHLYQKTEFELWKIHFTFPLFFTLPCVTDTVVCTSPELNSKCAQAVNDATIDVSSALYTNFHLEGMCYVPVTIITSTDLKETSPDTFTVPDDDPVSSCDIKGSSPDGDPFNFDKNYETISLSFASVPSIEGTTPNTSILMMLLFSS